MSYSDEYNNNNNDQQFDQQAANNAGYEAGRMEGDYDRDRNDVDRDVNRVEDAPENFARDTRQDFDGGVQDVEDAPSDMAGAVEGAAKWIGDKFGGVEGDAQRADGDVNQFDANIGSSFTQGQQQGEQQEGW